MVPSALGLTDVAGGGRVVRADAKLGAREAPCRRRGGGPRDSPASPAPASRADVPGRDLQKQLPSDLLWLLLLNYCSPWKRDRRFPQMNVAGGW